MHLMPLTRLDPISDADCYRHDAYRHMDPKRRSALGQFMTPAPIARFMASLFRSFPPEVKLLDPGAGVGALSAAFFERAKSQGVESIGITAIEIESLLLEYLRSTILVMQQISQENKIRFIPNIINGDFILEAVDRLSLELFYESPNFTHVIMNPPYRKIRSGSIHRRHLHTLGIETSNLYSAFLALAIRMLRNGGELVAIVPRSFCNGPYFKPFRQLLLSEASITRIHLFESRNQAFRTDDVLQENIIFHSIKGGKPGEVVVTTSPDAAFMKDPETASWTVDGMTHRIVPYESLVSLSDPEQIIQIVTSEMDQRVFDRLSLFKKNLGELGLHVSTGPVVDFRMKADWCHRPVPGTVPLLYAHNFDSAGVTWPKISKKPSALLLTNNSKKWLMPNIGSYVVTKRFSSKEEKRRIVANVYRSNLPGNLIGFENHLNVFHEDRKGLPADLASGLAAYLNSTLVDKYFRNFNGHTQVNAGDLRRLPYPDRGFLESLGKKAGPHRLDQVKIDELLEEEMGKMDDSNDFDPIHAQKKIDEALVVLRALGLPKTQQNERSALTLLALIGLKPKGSWQVLEAPLIGITPIMCFSRDVYGKEYAPNSREAFRRFTLHQFVQAGIALYNPDGPGRPVNSPKACYQISPEAKAVIREFGQPGWDSSLQNYLSTRSTLAQRYAKPRDMNMIPVKLDDGQEITLSPGKHNRLIRAIIEEFAPRFVPGSEIIYVGDTSSKSVYFQRDRLRSFGISLDRHGKMPDVVLYHKKKNWLLLIEAVTSHGPVDSKRHIELLNLFKDAQPGLVFGSAFPDRNTMARYLNEISWESEVWVSSSPSHMIQFNGVRFLGPYTSPKPE